MIQVYHLLKSVRHSGDYFQKNLKGSHLKSKQHMKALSSLRSSGSSSIPAPIPHAAPSFALLPTSHFLDKLLESLDEEETDNPQNPLDDLVIDEDGVFVDREGQPLVFSAGESQSTQWARQDVTVYQRLDNLDLLERHALFGEFDDSEAAEGPNSFFEDSSDSVVAQISAVIEALGKLHSQPQFLAYQQHC